MTVAPRITVAIATGMLCIAVPLALYAAPGGTRPIDHVDHSVRPISSGHASALPSDTVGKVEKGKTEKGAPSPKKKSLKGRQSGPSATSDPRQFVPDQPWETEFFVENDLTIGAHRGLYVLASARR